MPAPSRVVALAALMLFTGTINTISTKYQDMIVVGKDEQGAPLSFKHPAVQSAFMFFGEFMCLLPHLLSEWSSRDTKRGQARRAALDRRGAAFRARRLLVFVVPAACDAVATTMINVGLFYTYASVYQMLRGTLVLFAGGFTMLLLRRRLYIHHWLGMALITGGAALVGASSVLHAKSGSGHGPHPHPHPPPSLLQPNATGGHGAAAWGGALGSVLLPGMDGSVGGVGLWGSSWEDIVAGASALPRHLAGVLLGSEAAPDAAAAPLFGDLCIVFAQAFTALQFILEEKFVGQYRVPVLLAVGMEGAWGLAICAMGLPVLAVVKGRDGRPLDDAVQAMREVASHPALAGSVALSIVSIAFFNFFGISVTKALSGAARATIDACRTITIWLVALWLGWEHFQYLEVVGFIVLFSGTSLYNELIRICLPTVVEEESGSGSGSGSSYSGSDSEGDDPEGGEGGLQQPLLGSSKVGRAAGPLPLLHDMPALGSSPGIGAPLAHARSGSGGMPSPAAGAEAGAGGRMRAGLTSGSGHGVGVGVGASAAPIRSSRPSRSSRDEFTMARSMRLGMQTLNPHSLEVDDEEAILGSSNGDMGPMSFGSRPDADSALSPHEEGQEEEGVDTRGLFGVSHATLPIPTPPPPRPAPQWPAAGGGGSPVKSMGPSAPIASPLRGSRPAGGLSAALAGAGSPVRAGMQPPAAPVLTPEVPPSAPAPAPAPAPAQEAAAALVPPAADAGTQQAVEDEGLEGGGEDAQGASSAQAPRAVDKGRGGQGGKRGGGGGGGGKKGKKK